MTGGHAVSAVAHAVRDHCRARRPLPTAASVRAPLVRTLALVTVTAAGRVTGLTVTVGTVGEHAEHYGEPRVERGFRVAARTVATCGPA